jgi:hypothetical protein
MEQLYKLSGDPIDLEDLAGLFRTGSATVRKIDEHYYSGLADWDPAQTDSDALVQCPRNNIAYWSGKRLIRKDVESRCGDRINRAGEERT